MRYGWVALTLLVVAAVMLPVTRVTHSIIGTAQVVYALGLGLLLVRLVWRAGRPDALPDAGVAAAPAPERRTEDEGVE